MSEKVRLESLRDELKSFLTDERAALQKTHGLDEDSLYIRTEKDAGLILDTYFEVILAINSLIEHFPSLAAFVKEEFVSFGHLITRDNIIHVIYMEPYLIPEKKLFPLEENDIFKADLLEAAKTQLLAWVELKKFNHLSTLEEIRVFNEDLKTKDLACHCSLCLSEYRNKLREVIYKECETEIEKTEILFKENIHWGIDKLSDKFNDLRKNIDKKLYAVRFSLKRSTLNRLESQVKDLLKERFYYPSAIANLHVENMNQFIIDQLKRGGLRGDLISEEERARFFTQLGSQFWKGTNFLEKELKKLVSSVMLLKRKDISAGILKEYLGEFWIHARARKFNRKIIYHMGPTNSGKTYHAIEALAAARIGCYLAPLRLLAAELFDTLNSKGVFTSLLTGEEVIEVENGTHTSSTIEMAKFNIDYDCAVIDEIQMITDPQRGWAWTRALINICSPEVHICGDASVLSLIQAIVDLCGDTLEVKQYTRMTTLEVQPRPITLGELEKHDALIVFSRRKALNYKADLEKLGFKVSIVYGMLNPEVRREQAKKFDKGDTDIMVSTDAIAMGMNLPIRRIVFSTLTKSVNGRVFQISDSEIKQIAGRAGRFNRFPDGYVNCLKKEENGIDAINLALKAVLPQQELCMVGPDLDIFSKVNNALKSNSLPELKLSEFLRLFNTMNFKKPFFCVDMKEMIEIAEMVEQADSNHVLTNSEIFGFACAPVNLGLMDHVEYFVWILNHYVKTLPIKNEEINSESNDIDYLETAIKCVELYQWLARHFNGKNFEFEQTKLIENKNKAVEKLNDLLSERIMRRCSSCGVTLPDEFEYAICEGCFKNRRFPSKRRYDDKKDFTRDSGPRRSGGGGGRSSGGRSGSGAGSRPGSSSRKPGEKSGEKKTFKRKY